MKQNVIWCPLRFTNGKSHSADIDIGLKECLICKQILLTIIDSSYAFGSSRKRLPLIRDYGGNFHFRRSLVSLIQDFSKLLKNESPHKFQLVSGITSRKLLDVLNNFFLQFFLLFYPKTFP